MPDPVSIHERIDRELARRMALALPAWLAGEQAAGRVAAADAAAARVHRYDQDEEQARDYGLFSPLLDSDDSVAEPGGQGNGGYTTWRRDVAWMVFWQKRTQTDPAIASHHRIAAWLERQTIADDQLAEADTQAPLITDMEIRGTQLLEPVKDQTDMVSAIFFELIYDTRRGNPYLGPAAPERQEWQ